LTQSQYSNDFIVIFLENISIVKIVHQFLRLNIKTQGILGKKYKKIIYQMMKLLIAKQYSKREMNGF
jgi:hypothetical protein